MAKPKKASFHLSLCLFTLTITALTNSSTAATDSFIYGGCTQLKYLPNSPYQSNINSLLTSLVNSATILNYNNFTVAGPTSRDTIYGLFQCRGDLSSADCGRCVARAVTKLGTFCLNSCGGALQLDGCFVKYDNLTFLGVEDKTLVVKKCGPDVGFNSGDLTDRDAVLGFLGSGDGSDRSFRVGASGGVKGVAQCVGDLSASECEDCLSEAIGRLKSECPAAGWGDTFLAKCYARYWQGGGHSPDGSYNYKNDDGDHDDHNDAEVQKTLAILVGLIAAVALVILILSMFSRMCEKGKGGK